MRRPEPYFKKSHHAWYVNLNGKPNRLASEAEGETAAYKEYDKIMAGRQPIGADAKVLDLCQRFIDHLKVNKAPATAVWYHKHLSSFCGFVGNLRASDLRPLHVTEWIDRSRKTAKRARKTASGYVTEDTKKPIGDNYKRNLIRAVKTCFKWGEDQGYIDRSPLRGLKVTKATPRGDEAYLTPEQWEAFVGAVAKCRDKGALLDLITFLYHAGCRPQEARCIESRHVDLAGKRVTLPKLEAKGKKTERVIHLNDTALPIVTRLVAAHPQGPVFRNSKGKPWGCRTLDYRFLRLSRKVGFRVTPYSLRHSFCTNALTRGVSLTALATIMGHKDLAMIQRVYAHLGQRSDHIKEELKKATGES